MPVPDVPTRRPRRLLRDLTFETVLEAIVSGTLTPGERLFEDDLSTWLGVSKTPVKEALARLAGQGLVEIEANRFTRVADASAVDLVHTLELIGMLHAEAVRSAVDVDRRVTDDLAARLLASVTSPDTIGLVRATGAFLWHARNPLTRRAAEPLHNRATFLSRHLDVDFTAPAPSACLAELSAAVDAHEWVRAGDAVERLFCREALSHLVSEAPPRDPDPTIPIDLKGHQRP